MGAIARAAVLGMSALVLAAASTGGAATPATAAFSATLTGTIEESWQYRGRDVRDGCE